MPDRTILTFNQALEFIGFSKSYLYKMTSARKIPHYKKGSKLLFVKEELEAWLLDTPIMTEK